MKKDAVFVGSSLFIWWTVPILLTAGTPGYIAACGVLLLLLLTYSLSASNPAKLLLWVPFVGFTGLVVGAALLVAIWIGVTAATLPPNSPGGLAIAWILILLGPRVPAVLLALGIFIGLIWTGAPKATSRLWTVAILNTAFVGTAIAFVLNDFRGAAYFATKPKIVYIANGLPVTPDQKATARWLDSFQHSGLDVQMRMPLEFYGVAVDQDDKPLSGVTIRWALNPSIPNNNESEKGNAGVKTGDDGKFHLAGLHGTGIGLMIYKDGYQLTNSSDAMIQFTQLDYHSPHFFVPDPDHPVVFTFQKRLPPPPAPAQIDNRNIDPRLSGWWQAKDNAFDEFVLSGDGTGYHGSPYTVRQRPFIWTSDGNTIQFRYSGDSGMPERIETATYDPSVQTLALSETYQNSEGNHTVDKVYVRHAP